MKWSQLKKRIESQFAESVVGRVEVHSTRYHKAHDQMGRGWITFDKREVASMCSFVSERKVWMETQQRRRVTGCADFYDPAQREGYHRSYEEAVDAVHDSGIFSRWEFTASLFEYLNLSMDDILVSTNPIIRAIGMLDRRLGKRRLEAIQIKEENPIVQKLYELRINAERKSTKKK